MKNPAKSGMGQAAEAFSRQSVTFDATDAANPLIGWMRERVRTQALRHMRAGEHLLELNAGTGIDSAYFAARGLHVLATDVAPGMIEQQRSKQQHAVARWETMECSFLELDRLPDRSFHHVFSNFGGLNCTRQLDVVLNGVGRVLQPGGTCTLVIMPHFSPWEFATLLKGDLRLASRRFRTTAPARLEGVTFPCHYHSAGRVRRLLGAGYVVVEQRALSLLVPPPHLSSFPDRWPALFSMLSRMEDRVASLPILRNWGDHFAITLRKRS